MIKVKLTEKEASALSYAAGSIGEDIDSYGLDTEDKKAYWRAMAKLTEARRKEETK